MCSARAAVLSLYRCMAAGRVYNGRARALAFAFKALDFFTFIYSNQDL